MGEKIFISRNEMARYIDHTNLRPDATSRDIKVLCDEAATNGFASVCVNPVYAALAAARLSDTGIKVCTVVGFPLGAVTTETKAAEASCAVSQGAREIDMVLPVGMLKEGRDDAVGRDITQVVCAVTGADPGGIVKVIIETCLLNDGEKIKACRIAESAGAHFVKTSTGFASGGAVTHDVALMRKSVSSSIGVKASGGIRSAAQAVAMIRAGATRIGTSSGILILNQLEQVR